MRTIQHFAFSGILALAVLAGCASTTSSDPQSPQQPGSGPEAGAQSGGVTGSAPAGRPGAGPGAGSGPAASVDPRGDKRSVYYEFDGYDVKAEYRPLVQQHASYLAKNPAVSIVIEGNADERGSREYNVALGQRRAESVKKMMTLLGVREAQIESVSFGKEKPRTQGHDEKAWAENRRSDFAYRK
jgi:peptidoglycan-associated lipoprotein